MFRTFFLKNSWIWWSNKFWALRNFLIFWWKLLYEDKKNLRVCSWNCFLSNFFLRFPTENAFGFKFFMGFQSFRSVFKGYVMFRICRFWSSKLVSLFFELFSQFWLFVRTSESLIFINQHVTSRTNFSKSSTISKNFVKECDNHPKTSY